MTTGNIQGQLLSESGHMLQRPSITRGQRLVVAGLLRDAAAAIEALTRWKVEATEVLNAWEGVWMIAGQPGALGESKSQGLANEIQRLRSENAAWMNGVADAVEPLGYDRGAASGPDDLLPGLKTLAESSTVRKALGTMPPGALAELQRLHETNGREML